MNVRRSRRGSSRGDRARWAETYASTDYTQLPWYDPGPSPQVVEAVDEEFLPRPGPVLDVGCGAGSNVLYLARRGYDAHGVDLSPGAVAAAARRADAERLSADFRAGDALALDYPNGRFLGATDNGCFHTLPIRRRAQYAREIARVVRPGGAFVLAWIGREYTAERGPPHRPSLEEVVRTFEDRFVFVRTRFRGPAQEGGFAVYDAWLQRRSRPQPPAR